jgi:hypothetical protein
MNAPILSPIRNSLSHYQRFSGFSVSIRLYTYRKDREPFS